MDSLLPDFGRIFNKAWVRSCISVRLFIRRLTDSLRGLLFQVLKDLLRLCVLDFQGSWEDHIPLIEFAYNNSFQSSIDMTPYEALYVRKGRTPLTLTEVGDRQVMGSTFVDETVMKINLIKERLKAAQDRQQKYYNQKYRFVEFQVGDFMYVKVSLMKGVSRFGRVSKLSPRYVGPFDIIERIGKSAYRLLLSDQMSDVHNVFHICALRKWISDSDKKLSANEVEIQENMQYKEKPKKNLAYDVRKLRSKQIPMVKVQWKHRIAREATWEKESYMRHHGLSVLFCSVLSVCKPCTVSMGKNQTYKAMQRARLSGSAGAEEVEDGMVDGTFHSPEWHAARLASLNKSHTVTWEEFKRKQKEEELKKGELEADKDRMMREYRAQLDADRARKLAAGKNHSGLKLNHSKVKRDKDSKRRCSKKRKHKRKSSDSSSGFSSSESSSSDDDERESRRTRLKSRSKRAKKDRKHRSKPKRCSSDSEEGDGPVRLSRFFESVKS
ncbi:hypothetical protein KFK09_022550 [Dendrobium nobile]|uniref:Tf2-1-like SH3-like domain-containing protein n=1 Tax=Dendrobium nobile TaxID=94219 RepID=A0A8T3AIV3_DENNO|nr:hypothetical protein KFK09_022550 [Dendrobium nobile]